MEPMPADQVAEDNAILAASDAEENDEASGPEREGPEPKRPRTVE